MRRYAFTFATLFSALLLVAPGIFAQTITTGDITGTVTDASGAVVPNAAISLKGIDTGEARAVQSNGSGSYRFTLLKPGTYQVSAVTPGLKSEIVTGINVSVGQVQTLNLILKVQEGKEIVSVTDDAPLLQTDNINNTATYSTRQIELLPSPGGDLTNVAFTVPGVVVSTMGGFGNFSSHGLPGTSNLFTTNGIDNMDPYLNVANSGASNLTLGSNEVMEVSVVQNAYSGQYGRQAGAQVNFVTRGGTNQFHGNLLYNYNGSFLNANDFFNNSTGTPRSRALSNQYAASIGGAAIKNKLFFFADTEGIRYILPSSGTVAVPSQALQDYILRTVQPAQVPLYQRAFGLYNSAPGRNRAVPVTTNGPNANVSDSSGSLGCGSLANTPTGIGTKTFGVDTSCADAFNTNVSNQNKEWLMTERVDWNINDKQKIFFRFKTDHGLQPTNTDPINPLFNAYSSQPSYEGQITHTYVLTPRLINNFVGSASWYSAIFAPADFKATLAAFPTQFVINDGGSDGSGGITGLGNLNGSFPQGRRIGQLQVVDDLSYTLGNHSLKTGVNYRYNRVTDTGNQVLTQAGRFTFNGLDEFASGVINPASGSAYQQRYTSDSVVHLRLYNIGTYLQDEWALKPNVKLTMAVRFDHTGNPSCVDNCFARLDSPFGELQHGTAIPYNQSIKTGLSNAFPNIESVAVQPRVGIVWNPGRSKGTVIRSGFGLFADQFPAFLSGSVFSNSPNVYTPSVRTGTVNLSGTGSAAAISQSTGAAFRSGFANGLTLAQLQAQLAPVTFTPPPYFSVPNTVNNPKYAQWNFEVQQQLGQKNVLSISYVGNKGYDLFIRNLKVNASASAATYPNGFEGLPATAPDPRFRIVTDISNSGTSNYNGLSLSLRRGFGYGFQGQVSYTWSHALDEVSNGGTTLVFGNDSLSSQIDPYNLRRLNYSNADYDIRHNLAADFVWEVPSRVNNRYMKAALGGWSVAGKIYVRTGTPFSVFNTKIPSRVSNSTGGNALASLLDRNVNSSCGASAVDTPCLSTSQFATTLTQSDFGNLPRNSFRAPGYFDIDSTVYKNFRLTEHAKFTLGASAYNLMNHPNFASPGQDVSLPGAFGRITTTVGAPTSPYGSFQGSAVSGRVLVLTGKFSF